MPENTEEKSDTEFVAEQVDMMADSYEALVEKHGFVSGTIKYYKMILGM